MAVGATIGSHGLAFPQRLSPRLVGHRERPVAARLGVGLLVLLVVLVAVLVVRDRLFVQWDLAT
jgi:hypothetical protein